MIEPLGNVIGHFVSIAAALDFMQWVLVLGILFLGAVLSLCQFSKDQFDLRFLICTKGADCDGDWRPDLAKVIALGTWIAATWLVLAMGMSGKLTENFFAIWVLLGMAPKAIEAWIARKP